jgi:uncharacterized protein (DUF433 family)/DNA-binding transcriptional MerR regulator
MNLPVVVSRDDLRLYGDHDPRERPLYTLREAAQATDIPVSTIRAWVRGQAYRRKTDTGYFEPVIRPPDPSDHRLSFTNIIELHVLRALRTAHEVKLRQIREAIGIAEQELGIERLLVSPQLKAAAGELFLDHYTYLLELTRSQQWAMRAVLEQYLERVEFGSETTPVEFYPFERSPRNRGQRPILLSPFISFGRPVIRSRGISTKAIVRRLDAGESEEEILKDYEISESELEEAILYEAAA